MSRTALPRPRSRRLACAVLAASAGVAAADPVDDFNLGVKYYQFKQWDNAARVMAEFIAEAPDHPKVPLARLYRAQAFSEAKDFAKAREAFQEFIRLYPTHPQLALALYRIAESSFFLDEDEQADRQFTEYLRRYPDDDLAGWGREYLGELKLRGGDPEAALARFREVLSKNPEGTLREDAAYNQARALEQLGRLQEAVTAYRPIASSESTRSPAALFGLGASLFEMGQDAESLKAFDELARRFPKQKLAPLASLNAGYAAYRMEDFDTAVERFEAAAKSAPQEADARYWIGLARKQQGRYDAAAESLRASGEAAADPQAKAAALYQRADVLREAGKAEEALDAAVAAAADFPDAPAADDALQLATELALAAGKLDVAKQSHRTFVAKFPDSPLRGRQDLLAARVAVAAVEAAPADSAARKEAEETLNRLIAAGDETAERARIELARLRRRGGQLEDAAAVLSPLLDVDRRGVPDDARLLAASIRLEQKNYAEAARAARAVVEGVPANEPGGLPARLLYARAASELGRWDNVATALQDAENAGDAAAVAGGYADAAEAAYAAGEHERAAAWFREALEGPEPPDTVRSGLGHSLFEVGRFGDAAGVFAGLQKSAAGDDRPLASNAALLRGLSLEKAGRANEAADVYAKAAADFVDLTGKDELTGAAAETGINAYQLALKAARSAKDAGRPRDAETYYETAVAQLKRLPPERRVDLDKVINEWALMAYEAAGKTDDYGRADELFAKLLDETPDSKYADDARLYLAESAYFGGKTDKARKELAKLAVDESAEPYVRERANILLIDLEREAKRWDALAAASKSLIESFPQSASRPYAAFRLGEAELQTQDFKAAAEALRPLTEDPQAVRQEPWAEMAWILLSEALVGAKDYAAVGPLVRQFNELFPGSKRAYRFDEMLGRAYYKQAEFEKSREAYGRVLDSPDGRLTETAAKSQFMIGETLTAEKDFDAARDAYFKVYTVYAFPEWQAPALLQAAAADEALGNWGGAKQFYETLLQDFPDSEYAERAKPKLEAVKLKAGS